MLTDPFIIRFAYCDQCKTQIIVSCTDIEFYDDLKNEREDLEMLGWTWVSKDVQYCAPCWEVISSIRKEANDLRRTVG